MPVTIGRRELLAALGVAAAAWPVVPSAPACVAVERSIGLVLQVALPADRPDVRPLAQQVQRWNASPEVEDGRGW